MRFNIAVFALVAVIAPTLAKTVDVKIVDGKFEPQEVNVAPGDSVRWPMDGDGTHAIVETVAGARSCDSKPGGFNSGSKTKGQPYVRTFPTAGVVNYKDGIGSNCKDGAQGTIIIGDKSSGNAPIQTSSRPGTPSSVPINGAMTKEVPIILGAACIIGALAGL